MHTVFALITKHQTHMHVRVYLQSIIAYCSDYKTSYPRACLSTSAIHKCIFALITKYHIQMHALHIRHPCINAYSLSIYSQWMDNAHPQSKIAHFKNTRIFKALPCSNEYNNVQLPCFNHKNCCLLSASICWLWQLHFYIENCNLVVFFACHSQFFHIVALSLSRS